MRYLLSVLFCLLTARWSCAAQLPPLADCVGQITVALPKSGEAFGEWNPASFNEWVHYTDYVSGEVAAIINPPRPADIVAAVQQLVTAKQTVDGLLEQTLRLRTGLLSGEDSVRRPRICNYLHATSSLIDLSGRLRYTLFDGIQTATEMLSDSPAELNQVFDLLIAAKSTVGAEATLQYLFDPPPEVDGTRVTVSPTLRSKALQLIALAGNADVLPELVQFVQGPTATPPLKVLAAEAIVRIGLPQPVSATQDPTLPKPVIQAGQLREIVERLSPAALSADLRTRREQLLAKLAAQASPETRQISTQFDGMSLQPGDWLLMRNPSPYNLFTDLTPGLFTHVGIVAADRGTDGIERLVIVDLPERGTRMPATNVEIFLQRTRHYLFLRHRDPAVAQKMGAFAASVIGSETQFDLNFRTDRVAQLATEPLEGKCIHTYCTGFLLLCALKTELQRETFFPLNESPGGGEMAKNLETLGLLFGSDFLSPTSALYSDNFEIVGGREPMYDPRREIEEGIYDHFARQMVNRRLRLAPDAFQALRQKTAEYTKGNPLLNRALAAAANVNAQTDLAAAAQAAAVVETLDEIAQGAAREFLQAGAAIRELPSASENDPANPRNKPERNERPLGRRAGREARGQARANQAKKPANAPVSPYPTQHAKLAQMYTSEQLSPRGLRIELVKYYLELGKRQIDQRFFTAN